MAASLVNNTKRVSLVWFKNTDLRIHDHLPLLSAHKSSDSVIHLMVIDTFWFRNKTQLLGISKTGPFRCKFLKESILDLRKNLNSINSELIIRYGSSSNIIPNIVKQYNVNNIYYHSEIHSEEQSIVNQVITNCNKITNNNIKFISHWGGNTLYDPRDLPWNDMQNTPATFTKFRKAVEKGIVIQKPVEPLTAKIAKPHPKFEEIGDVTSLKQLGCEVDDVKIDERTQFPFSGGESSAIERLNNYIWGNRKSHSQRGPLTTYKKTRNGSIGSEYSTKFSPFLAHGNLSPRLIYNNIKNFENSTGISNDSTYWVYFELLWRDFFRFSSCKYGDKIFYLNGPYGHSLYSLFADPNWKWSHDKILFNKWCNGETGYPFIDAAMIELKLTGFMSNRLRQNVASFLIKDMGIDWRWGAEYFESLLIDYDPAQNYCNWNYIAGIGFDPCSHSRYFNIHKQAWTYDRNGEFVKLWIPKLKSLSKDYIHKPYEMNKQQQEINRCIVGKDYYEPICKLNPPKNKKDIYNGKKNDKNWRGNNKKYNNQWDNNNNNGNNANNGGYHKRRW